MQTCRCGRPVSRRAAYGPVPRYCSDGCKKAARNAVKRAERRRAWCYSLGLGELSSEQDVLALDDNLLLAGKRSPIGLRS